MRLVAYQQGSSMSVSDCGSMTSLCLCLLSFSIQFSFPHLALFFLLCYRLKAVSLLTNAIHSIQRGILHHMTECGLIYCCGTIILHTVKACCSHWFNKELNGQQLCRKRRRCESQPETILGRKVESPVRQRGHKTYKRTGKSYDHVTTCRLIKMD